VLEFIAFLLFTAGGVIVYQRYLYVKGRALKAQYDTLSDDLYRNPTNPATYDTLVALFSTLTNRYALEKHGVTIDRLYAAALENLRLNPQISHAKVFALDIGRRFYSSKRNGKTLTTYDELALANDIAARSG
jgi:hypothetical protein